MKKKLLIGGGLVALVAVIAAIAVFGKGGEFFKGSLSGLKDLPKFEFETPDLSKFEESATLTTKDAFSTTYEFEKITVAPAEIADIPKPNIKDELEILPLETDPTPPVEAEEVKPTQPKPSAPVPSFNCGEWKDVSTKDAEYDMWMYLCEKGILQGDSDGNLRPDDKLNRAELLTLAFRASEYANVYSVNNNAKNCFPDVKTQWYAKFFCTGKSKGFIKGYDDGYARPERGVILAEGLKMFLGALDETIDAPEPDCWYCPMVKEAGDNKYLPYSFTDPKQVGPVELTRGKAFNMLYRIMYYR